MSNELESSPIYAGTMKKLEAVKRIAKNGVDYWMARDINNILGYPSWSKFEAVIDRADNWRSQGGDEVGRVDMTGYARWLQQELGWQPAPT